MAFDSSRLFKIASEEKVTGVNPSELLQNLSPPPNRMNMILDQMHYLQEAVKTISENQQQNNDRINQIDMQIGLLRTEIITLLNRNPSDLN